MGDEGTSTRRIHAAAEKLAILRGDPPRSWESVEHILALSGSLGQKAIKSRHAQAWECQNPLCGWITSPLDGGARPTQCGRCGSVQLRQIMATLHYISNPQSGVQAVYTAADFAIDFYAWADLVTASQMTHCILRLWAEEGLCADCDPHSHHCQIAARLGLPPRGPGTHPCEILEKVRRLWREG